MWRFMLVTFGFLGFAFYELSGGADYRPSDGSLQQVMAERRATEAQPQTALARAKALDAVPEPAKTAQEPGSSTLILAAAGTDSLAPTPAPEKPAPITLSQPVIDVEKADELTVLAESIIQPRAEAEPQEDIREVTASRVNLRNGPGVGYPRVGGLSRGDEVEVIADDGSGWVKLRVLESGRVAYIADFLLSEPRTDAQYASN